MLPTQVNYPEFVPDQLLTSAHLNQLFGYLEEQGRLTRTNVLGIGVVCGMEVQTNATGTAVTITGGCGLTSEGYLIAVPEVTYHSTKAYNAVQERIYPSFVDGSKNQRFDILELKQAAVEEGTAPLNADALTDKVVLLFVEILEEGAKNCNPNSCDDKGVNATVTFRPLLIDKADADQMSTANQLPKDVAALPELKIRRYDVPATKMADTAGVFSAYQMLLDNSFLRNTEKALTQAYKTFAPLLLDLYPSNPFKSLAADFKFLSNGTISLEQLMHIQYYYDLFSDLIYAYEELRKAGEELIGLCCPDSNLFPRHLFLGLALSEGKPIHAAYREYFIPSPVLHGKSGRVKAMRWLFKRLVLLLDKFYLPGRNAGSIAGMKRAKTDDAIRITPSKYGPVPLSEKAIPYYYDVLGGTDKLLDYWNFKRSSVLQSEKNLSYYSRDYDTTDEAIITPLNYDLEPYNFLRIEGHIGKTYTEVLRNLLLMKRQHRLPFEVIALSTDVAALWTQVKGLAISNSAGSLAMNTGQDQPMCQFQDLQSLYNALASELICGLCKEMKYFYDVPGSGELPAPNSTVPQVPLLIKCDPNFRFSPGSLGHQFELFYETVKAQPYVNSSFFLGAVILGSRSTTAGNGSERIGLGLLYYIEKLSEILVEDLSAFDIDVFNTRYHDLIEVASRIRTILRGESGNTGDTGLAEDVLDHLDALIFACKQAQFNALHKDYLGRWAYVMMLQKFGYFLEKHPGIQHKAGVSIGGTFILVYHEEKAEAEDNIAVLNEAIRSTISDSAHTARAAAKEAEGAGTAKKEKKSVQTLEEELAKHRAAAGDKMNAITELDFMEHLLSGAAKVNRSFDGLIQEIDNGTVIADFYLPYLCYSDCPPVHYILPEEKPEPSEPVSLEIEQKEYCSADKTAFSIVLSPEGGELTGEGTKIGTKGAIFSPAAVDLQGEKEKQVLLSYSKGGQSDNKTLIVYQTPTAKFKVAQDPKKVNRFDFTNESDFADSFEWEFGDEGTSDEENPSHSYETEGSYTVSLVVVNGTCRSPKKTVQVEVKKAAEPIRDCLPAGGLIEEFNALESLDRDLFPTFIKTFNPHYDEVAQLFRNFMKVTESGIPAQLDFLLKSKIERLMAKWLAELFRLMTNSDLMVLAYGLYGILLRLAMYIECIQEEDFEETRIKLSEAFKLIEEHLNAIKNLAQDSSFHKQQLRKLLKMFMEELTRIDKEKKPGYAALITRLSETK